MSGGGSQATQQTQTSAPAYLQPYEQYGLQQATKLYQSAAPSYYPGSQVAAPSMATQAGWQDAIARAQQGSQVGNAAQQYGTDVLKGGFLGLNPYQQQVNQSIYASTIPAVDAQFSMGGRYGSGAQQGTLGTAIANQIAPMEYQNYQQERANQQQMAGMAPSLGAQDWTDIQGLLGVGGAQDQLAQNQINANIQHWNYNQNLAMNKLAQYMQMLGGMPGSQTTATSTPAGSDAGSQILKILGGVAGAALMSDRTMKEDIAPLEGSLAKVEKLQGVSFTMIDDDRKRRQIGFVAQEVERIVPEVVEEVRAGRTGDETKLGVHYANLTALLVEAVKELSAKVAALEADHGHS